MIKLLDNPANISKLVSKSPYLGGRILKEATVFYGDMDLMNVWYETDDRGKTVCASLFDGKTITVISDKKGPGNEMLLFINNIVSSGSAVKITCDATSFDKLIKIFPHSVKERNILKCSRHVRTSNIPYTVNDENDPKDIASVLSSASLTESFGDTDMFTFRILRGRQRGQVKTFTAYDKTSPIGISIINGITPSGGNIDSVVTDIRYRHMGIATHLVSLCCEYLKNMKLDCYLVPENDDLIPFYENIGFKKHIKIFDINVSEE